MARAPFDPEKHAPRLAASGAAGVLLGVWLGGWAGGGLAALGLGLLLLACWSRADGFLVFGPLVGFELTRIARRRYHFLWRGAYALGLLGVLSLVYVSALEPSWESLFSFSSSVVPIDRMADFAQGFFIALAVVQFATVVALMPTTAERIGNEKDLRTLEFLLTTDLRNREIVLGKMLAGTLHVLSFVLVGVPILALLPLFGGVDPQVALAVATAVVLTLLGVSGMAVAGAVYATTAERAVVNTLRLVATYVFLSLASWLLLVPQGWADFPSFGSWQSPVTVRDAVEALNAGNPLPVIGMLIQDLEGGAKLEDVLPGYLRGYAVCHLLFFLGFGLTGIAHLRAAAVWQTGAPGGKPTDAKSKEWKARSRPPVWDRPVLWKAIYLEAYRPGSRLERVLLVTIAMVFFSPPLILLGVWVVGADAAENLNLLARNIGPIGATVGILSTGAFAARGLAREREKQTYDSLVLTAMEPRQILWEKWLGSIHAGGGLGTTIWLVLNWIPLCLIGALHPLGLVLLPAVTLVYVAFAASLGTWCAVRQPTMRKAMNRYHGVIAYIVAAGGGLAVLMGSLGFEEYSLLPLLVFLPPAVIALLTFRSSDFALLDHPSGAYLFGGAVVLGVALYAYFAWNLWRVSAEAFERPPGPEKPKPAA